MKSHLHRSLPPRLFSQLLAGLFFMGLLPALLGGNEPSWWITRGVKSNAAASDFSPINQGQLKNFVVAAVAELDACLPEGAGQTLHQLVASWVPPGPQAKDYAPVNLGQLKTVAKPIYDRLIEVGYATQYPWAGQQAAAKNYAIANIGQAKNLFLFDLSTRDSDGNGLPDWWELYYFGRIGLDPNQSEDGGTLTNLEKYQRGLNPTINQALTSPARVNYVYDALGRLISVSGGPQGNNYTFVYDAEGNITSVR